MLVDSGEYDEKYRHMASLIVDGSNSEGLIVNINVVPEDLNIPDHSNLGAPSFCNAIVTRYLLDNAATVEEAIKLMKEIDIWPYKLTNGYRLLVHWHISDATGKSVIAEIVEGGKIQTIENDIMTNYYNTIPLTPHANGIERYNILESGKSSVTDKESLIALMKQIRFTKAYTSTDPIWYSELNGKDDKFGDLTIYSKPEDYAEKFAYYQNEFANRSRDTGTTWESCHMSVYDMENKTLTILSQESDTEYVFDL